MADHAASIPEHQVDTDFIELAVEMALLDRNAETPDAFTSAESVLSEAVEFRKTTKRR